MLPHTMDVFRLFWEKGTLGIIAFIILSLAQWRRQIVCQEIKLAGKSSSPKVLSQLRKDWLNKTLTDQYRRRVNITLHWLSRIFETRSKTKQEHADAWSIGAFFFSIGLAFIYPSIFLVGGWVVGGNGSLGDLEILHSQTPWLIRALIFLALIMPLAVTILPWPSEIFRAIIFSLAVSCTIISTILIVLSGAIAVAIAAFSSVVIAISVVFVGLRGITGAGAIIIAVSVTGSIALVAGGIVNSNSLATLIITCLIVAYAATAITKTIGHTASGKHSATIYIIFALSLLVMSFFGSIFSTIDLIKSSLIESGAIELFTPELINNRFADNLELGAQNRIILSADDVDTYFIFASIVISAVSFPFFLIIVAIISYRRSTTLGAAAGSFSAAITAMFATTPTGFFLCTLVGLVTGSITGLSVTIQKLSRSYKHGGLAIVYSSIILIGLWAAFALDGGTKWLSISTSTSAALILLALLPISNAFLDWISLGLTRWLLVHLILHKHQLILFVTITILDILAAAVFLVLVAMSAVTALGVAERLHLLGGSQPPTFSTSLLLEDLGTAPFSIDYFWIYMMLGTTLIPTVLHFSAMIYGLFATVWADKFKDAIDNRMEMGEEYNIAKAARWAGRVEFASIALPGFALLLAIWTYAKFGAYGMSTLLTWAQNWNAAIQSWSGFPFF